MANTKRVGYWWSEKKSQKMNVAELAQHFVDKGCEFIRLDLDLDLELQGPFDAIIHKLSDVMCKADRDATAAQQVKSFEVIFVWRPQNISLPINVDTIAHLKLVHSLAVTFQCFDRVMLHTTTQHS